MNDSNKPEAGQQGFPTGHESRKTAADDIFARDLNGEMVSPNDAGYEELIADIFATMQTAAEMNDPKSRPALKEVKENIADYDVVFIGYPIWWDLAPRIIDTFIESHDLRGKTIIPFATSGGSSLAGSAAALKKSHPALNWKEGRLLNRADEKTIRAWIEKSGY